MTTPDDPPTRKGAVLFLGLAATWVRGGLVSSILAHMRGGAECQLAVVGAFGWQRAKMAVRCA
jgi:hypothetical protein